MAIPFAAGVGGSLLAGLFGKKRPSRFRYPGQEEEIALEGRLRSQLEESGDSRGHTSRLRRTLDRGTERAFKRRQGQRRERGARLGLGGSSFDKGIDARLTREEGEAFGENALRATETGRRFGREDLQSLLRKFGAVRGAGRRTGEGQLALDTAAAEDSAGFFGGVGGAIGKEVGGRFGGDDLFKFLGRKRRTPGQGASLGGGRFGL